MGYLAIKTSEWETNFYRRCLNSEPKPAAAPGSSSEGILSDWISAFGRQADTVWSCPLSFLWRVDIIWHYLVTRWHYLTVSWHCPLGHPKTDLWLYSFTKMKLNAKNTARIVNIVQCPLSTTKRQVALVTEMLSTVRVPRAGVDKWPNFVFWFSCSVLCILYLIFVVCDMACHGKGWCGYINDPILCFVFVCFDFYADKGWCGG